MANIQKVALVDRGKVISSGSGEGGSGDTTIRYNEETDWIQVLFNDTWTNCYYAGVKLDPSKMELTQDEFIAICNQGLQSRMSIGAIIHMNNYYCTDYEVIDVNHDGTSDTVDIMAHTQVYSMNFGSNNDYNTSDIRDWINSTYIDAFDYDIRELMKTQQVVTKGVTQNDKAKLLSWREIGITYDSTYLDSTDGGAQYPVFTAGAYNSAILDRWRNAGNYGYSIYWLRSKYKPNTSHIVIVYNTGACDWDYGASYGVLPVMRF